MNISFNNYMNNKEKGKTIDIRDKYKYNMNHLNGSINIYVNDILNNLNILSKDETYFLICDSGRISFKLSRLLNNLGYKTYSIEGGYNYL